MGLACSHMISQAMGGDTALKRSCEGLTSFAFKIQVQRVQEADQILEEVKEDPHLNDKFFEEIKSSKKAVNYLRGREVKSYEVVSVKSDIRAKHPEKSSSM